MRLNKKVGEKICHVKVKEKEKAREKAVKRVKAIVN